MVRRMQEIGWEVLSNRAGVAAKEDACIGFHWPLTLVKHLHLHVIAPASSMGMINKVIFSRKLFGDVDEAIDLLKQKGR